jgi:hypothetical protein
MDLKQKKYKYKFLKSVALGEYSNIHTYLSKYLSYSTDEQINNKYKKINKLILKGGSNHMFKNINFKQDLENRFKEVLLGMYDSNIIEEIYNELKVGGSNSISNGRSNGLKLELDDFISKTIYSLYNDPKISLKIKKGIKKELGLVGGAGDDDDDDDFKPKCEDDNDSAINDLWENFKNEKQKQYIGGLKFVEDKIIIFDFFMHIIKFIIEGNELPKEEKDDKISLIINRIIKREIDCEFDDQSFFEKFNEQNIKKFIASYRRDITEEEINEAFDEDEDEDENKIYFKKLIDIIKSYLQNIDEEVARLAAVPPAVVPPQVAPAVVPPQVAQAVVPPPAPAVGPPAVVPSAPPGPPAVVPPAPPAPPAVVPPAKKIENCASNDFQPKCESDNDFNTLRKIFFKKNNKGCEVEAREKYKKFIAACEANGINTHLSFGEDQIKEFGEDEIKEFGEDEIKEFGEDEIKEFGEDEIKVSGRVDKIKKTIESDLNKMLDKINKTKVKPSTVTPSTVTPSTVTPSTVTPSTVTPSTDTPSTVTPSTVTPSTVTPSTDTPSTVTPSTDTPSTVTPSAVKPSAVKPSTAPKVTYTDEELGSSGDYYQTYSYPLFSTNMQLPALDLSQYPGVIVSDNDTKSDSDKYLKKTENRIRKMRNN